MRKIWFLGLLGFAGCSSQDPNPIIVSSKPTPEPSPVGQPIPFVTFAPMATPTSAPPTPEDIAILQETQKIQAADPIADMEKAWQQGDRKFAAVKGAGLYVPGVKEEKCAAMLNQYGARVVCTPGDVNLTEEKQKLGAAGTKYAVIYNHLLLKKLNLANNIENPSNHL